MGLLNSALDFALEKLAGKSESGGAFAHDIASIYDVKFDTNSNFEITMFQCRGLHSLNYFSEKARTDVASTARNKEMSLCLQSYNVGAVTSDPIEEWINGRWVITTGRPTMKYLTVTFRDHSAGKMYNAFKDAFWYLRNEFPSKQAWDIQFSTINDRANWAKGDLIPTKAGKSNSTPILATSTAVLDSIGELRLDKSDNNGFSTFDVMFRYYITLGAN